MIEFPKDSQQATITSIPDNIKVLGVGGAGCNVVDRMAMDGSSGLEVVSCNTDTRALSHGVTAIKIQLGASLTRGLGAGGDPEIGRAAAVESAADLLAAVMDRRLVFMCVGLGGGTGSGAAPEIARIARAAGAMLVAFVTMPFSFEGGRRVAQAKEALEALRRETDAVIVFENDRIGELALATDGVQKAFDAADRLVGNSIRAVARIVSQSGMIRVGLDDLMAVLKPGAGYCLFGHGSADGESRAKDALERAMKSPLLDKGRMLDHAATLLVHVTGGDDLRLFEVQTLMRELDRHVAQNTRIFFGMGVDPVLKKSVAVTIFCPLGKESTIKPAIKETTEQPAVVATKVENLPVATTPAVSGGALELFDTISLTQEDDNTSTEDVPVSEVITEQIADEVSDDTTAIEAIPGADEEFLDASASATEVDQSSIVEAHEVVDAEIESETPEPVAIEPERVEEKVVIEPEPEPEPHSKTVLPPPRGRRSQEQRPEDMVAPADPAGQRELRLGSSPAGRFANAEPTVIDGEDLDLPAYLRKRRR